MLTKLWDHEHIHLSEFIKTWPLGFCLVLGTAQLQETSAVSKNLFIYKLPQEAWKPHRVTLQYEVQKLRALLFWAAQEDSLGAALTVQGRSRDSVKLCLLVHKIIQ